MSLLSTCRYRARNSADGSTMRIACLLTIVVLVTLGVFLGMSSDQLFGNNKLRSGAPQHIYEDEDWDQLPSEVQKAAKTMGYSKKTWDHDQATERFDEDWWDLTTEQRDAAGVLGYDEATWCDEFDDYQEEMADRREFYPEWMWDDLPSDVQKAAKQFGFTKNEWDNDIPVMGFDVEWNQLADGKKEAAITLGYDEESWCASEEDYVEEQADNWLDSDWAELPNNVKKAAKVFGFDSDKWDNELDVPAFSNDWEELTKQQQNAAITLGYTENIWCDDKEEWVESEEAVQWMNEDWETLPSDVKQAAKLFGFNKYKWDNEKYVPTFDNDWDDLTNELKDAAVLMGYNESLWCDDFDAYEDQIRVDYEQSDWAGLPQPVKSAAWVLGFSQDSWDNDTKIPSLDKDWQELSNAEQQAAITLGWDRDVWCEEFEGGRARQ